MTAVRPGGDDATFVLSELEALSTDPRCRAADRHEAEGLVKRARRIALERMLVALKGTRCKASRRQRTAW
jgi:hypothetical protein